MNGLTPPKSGATEWPTGPGPRASRGAPEPSDAFAGILDSHQARTATAEGQDRSPKTTGRDRHDDGPVANERAEARSNAEWARERREADGVERDHAAQHDGKDVTATPADSAEAPATPVADGEPALPQAEVAQLPPVAAPVATPVAVEAAPVVVADAPAQAVPQQPEAAVVAAAPEQAQQQQEPQQSSPQQVAVAGPAQQDEPAEQAGVAPQLATEVVAAAEGAADDSAPAGRELPASGATDRPASPAAVAQPRAKAHAADASGQQGEQREGGTLPQPAAEQARTVAQAYGRTAQHTNPEVPASAQSGTPAASPATPVAGGLPAAARGEFPAATPVPLARAAENVEHVLRLAANRGVTHARIALNPQSLGSVDVHLRHTADGLVATVVAHSPEAAQQLQQAAADLRRQLEGQGVNLLSLDIGQSAGDERSASRAGAGFGDDGRGEGRAHSNGTGSAAGPDAETTVKSTLQLPNGVLVDVLA